MALILSLETATKNCSVSLSENGEVLGLVEESSDQYIHSEKLHLFIREVLEKAGRQPSDLQAVAVDKGPGSYTGLRIGVSAAKGLCYSLNIPMMSFDSLEVLVSAFTRDNKTCKDDLIIPMLDARRMEVYCSVHDHSGKRLREIEARVIDAGSFDDLPAAKIHLIGDGAEKLKEVLPQEHFLWHNLPYPSATAIAALSEDAFAQQKFEDVAYFEPFYLKDFVAGKPKKLL